MPHCTRIDDHFGLGQWCFQNALEGLVGIVQWESGGSAAMFSLLCCVRLFNSDQLLT